MKSKTLTLKDDHKKDISRSLAFLRKNDRFSNLKWVCTTYNKNGSIKTNIVSAHVALFRTVSPLLSKIFDITDKKQPYEDVYITLDEQDFNIVNKLTESLYLGQTTVNSKDRAKLKELVDLLKVKIDLTVDDSSESSSDGRDSPVHAKKPVGPKSKSKPEPEPIKSRKKSNVDDLEELKEKARENKGKLVLERVEKSSDNEVKKYYKTATASGGEAEPSQKPLLVRNPFHKNVGVKSAPQKRRLTDSDKKVVSKASKKPRQEGDSTTDEDQEDAKAARKREMPISLTKKSKKDSSDDDSDEIKSKSSKKEVPKKVTSKVRSTSESSVDVKASKEVTKSRGRKSSGTDDSEPPAKSAPKKPDSKFKPGPKSKAGPASAKPKNEEERPPKKESKEKVKAAAESIFTDGHDQIRCCDHCGKIFVTNESYRNHMKTHDKPKTSSDSESDSSDHGEKNDRVKKSSAKIKEERRKSKKSSSSSDDDDKEKPKPAQKAIKNKPGPKSKAGPASSKSANKDEEPPKTPISLKLTTKKAGPASKVKKSDTGDTPGPASKVNKNDDSCKLSFDTSSDSDGDSPKAKTPKVKISLSSSSSSVKKPIEKKSPSKKDTSAPSIGPHRCRFCENGFDKASNLKNHVLNHFKEQMLLKLPSCLPFLCPECTKPSRDKITLLRHYSFGHSKVFEIAAEEDFKARPPGHPIRQAPTASRPSQNISKKPSSKPKVGPASSKKVPKKAEKSVEKINTSSSSSLSSDSDSDVPKKKSIKESDVQNQEDKKTDEKKSDSETEKKEVKEDAESKNLFSSDEEEDLETKKAKAEAQNAASGLFDELFNDNKSKSEEADKKEPITEDKTAISEENVNGVEDD